MKLWYVCYYRLMDHPTIESVAKALLINGDNKVLVLAIGEHRQSPEKSYAPDLPGGLVDQGEYERQAVVREVFEETGIIVPENQAQLVYSKTEFRQNENKSISKHLFILRVTGNPEVILSWEHTKFTWVDLSELRQVDFRPFYNEAIDYCLKNNVL